MREWSQTMRELGIVPIFPPREDVQIGDIYAYPYDPDAKETEQALLKGDLRIGISPRWASLDLLDLIKAEYEQRPSWPPTPASYSEILSPPPGQTIPRTPDKVWNQPSGPGNIFESEPEMKRLRLVGFPDFASATFSQGDLSAVIPIEALNLALGAGWSDAKSVIVKVPSAESYALSQSVILDELLEGAAQEDRQSLQSRYTDPKFSGLISGPLQKIKEPYRNGLTFIAEQSLQTLWLRVTTEVYYARALDIAVQSKRTAGGAASVKPIASVPVPGDQPRPEVIDPSLTPLQRAQQLNHSLAQAGASTVPGGFFRFVTATDASVSMRRVWERDIAIGFRGLLLEVDKHTGVVMRAGTTFGVSPTLN